MEKLRILMAFAFVFAALSIYGQQEPMYGQYIFNNSVINPAQAGANEMNQWGVLARFQFIGIDGSPRTNSAYANLRLPKNLGLAVGIYQDQLGIEENLHLQTDLAYHARLSDRWVLSAGIRALISSDSRSFVDLQHLEPDDPYFRSNVNSGVMLNAGAGLLLSSQKFFIGAGMPRVFLNEMKIYDPGNYAFMKNPNRHLFVYAGTNLPFLQDFVFMPSTLFKYSHDAPVQLDLNAVFDYSNILSFGPLLRSNLKEGFVDAVGFLVGLRLGEFWHFGYVFEYPTNDLNLVTRQTHELSLRFVWGPKKDERIRSPRYFL